MMLRLRTYRRYAHAASLALVALAGCGSDAGAKHEEGRKAAYVAYGEALTAYKAKDYATAEQKLTAAIDARGLNPDIYCSAVAKRAHCWALTSKLDEALADLESLGPAASNLDEIFVIQSFIYKKQGKTAPARDALNKAKRINPRVQEIKG